MNKINKVGFMIAICVIVLNSLLSAVGIKEGGEDLLASADIVLLAISFILILVE